MIFPRCFLLVALWAALFLSGCAQQPLNPMAEPATPAPAEQAAAPAPVPERELILPKNKLNPGTLYAFIYGEFLAQRGKYPEAAHIFLKLARDTRDPRLARRASELAFSARMGEAATEAVQIWLETDPESPEVHYTMAQLALQKGQNDLALAEARTATRLKPEWESAVLLEAQLIQRSEGTEAAINRLAAHLRAFPKAHSVRFSYARVLWATKQYKAARAEFEQVLQDNPANPEVLFTVAELALQLQDYESAQTYFKRLLDLEYEHQNSDSARIYLGQIAELQKKPDEALQWYDAVTPGEQYMNAQFRALQVEIKQNKIDAARKRLHAITPQNNQQRVRLLLAEAALLDEAGRKQEAFDVLHAGLEKLPNDTELLYQYSMAAEKINRFDLLESSLRTVIRLQPNHAHAHNALGYSLADRNERLPEALELIKKANALAPDDHFIMDSMGWVYYRMGRNDEALDWLRRAYAGRADAEIAAHLGEVLWATGQYTEAQKLWTEALGRAPKNQVLLETVRRLQK